MPGARLPCVRSSPCAWPVCRPPRFYEYDVAIIDWRMPGAEGIDVVAWARRNRRPTAILMLTARDTPADRIRGLDTGADDYLVKPFDFGELLARVRALQRRPRGVDGPSI